MQIKTIVRCHFMPVRMTTKRTSVSKDVEEREPSCIVSANVNWYDTATVENSMDVSQKAKYGTTIWCCSHTLRYLPKENHNSKRCMHLNVYCSTVYDSQNVEAIKIHQHRDE